MSNSKAVIVSDGLFSRRYEPAGQTASVAINSGLNLDAINLWCGGYTRAIMAILGPRETNTDYLLFYEQIFLDLSTNAPAGSPPQNTRMTKTLAFMFSLIKGKHKGTFSNGEFTAMFRSTSNPSVPEPNIPLMLPDPGPDTPNGIALRRIPLAPGSLIATRVVAYEKICAAVAQATGQPLVDYDSINTTNITEHFARVSLQTQAESPHGIFFNIYAFPKDNARHRMLAALNLTLNNSTGASTIVEWTNTLLPSHMTPANVGSHMALNNNKLDHDVITVAIDVMHYVLWWIGVMDGILLQNKETGSPDFPLPSFLTPGGTFDITYFALAYILQPLYNQFRNNQVHVPIASGPVPVSSTFFGDYVETGSCNVPPLKAELVGLKHPAVVVEALRRMSPPLRMPTSQGTNNYVPVLAGDWAPIKLAIADALTGWGQTTEDTAPNLNCIRMADALTGIKYSINAPETGAYRDMIASAQVDFRKAKPYLGLATLSAYNEAHSTFTGMMRIAYSEEVLPGLRDSLRTNLSEESRAAVQQQIAEMEAIMKERLLKKAERAEAHPNTPTARSTALPVAPSGLVFGTIFFGKPNPKANLALDFPIPTIFVPVNFGGQGNDDKVNTMRVFLRAKTMVTSSKLVPPAGLLYSGGLALARAPTQDDPSDEVSLFFRKMADAGVGGLLDMAQEVDTGVKIAKEVMNAAEVLVSQGGRIIQNVDHQFSTEAGRQARSQRHAAKRERIAARKQHRLDNKEANRDAVAKAKTERKVNRAKSNTKKKVPK